MTASTTRQEIVRDYFYRSYSIVRIWMMIAVCLYAFFGVLDQQMIPFNKYDVWTIRYIFTVPAMVITILATFFVASNKKMELLIALFVAIGAVGLAAMIANLSPEEKAFDLYFVGFLAMMAWTQIIGFRNRTYTLMSLFIILLYNVVAVFFQKLYATNLAAFIFVDLFFVTFFVFGFYSSRVIEQFVLEDNRKTLEIDNDKLKLLQNQVDLQQANDLKGRLLMVMSNDMKSSLEDLRQEFYKESNVRKSAAPVLSKIEFLDALTTTTISWLNLQEQSRSQKIDVINVRNLVQEVAERLDATKKLKNLDFKLCVHDEDQIAGAGATISVAILNILHVLVREHNDGDIVIASGRDNGKIILTFAFQCAATGNCNEHDVDGGNIEQMSVENAFGLNVARQLMNLNGGAVEAFKNHGQFGFRLVAPAYSN